MENWKPIAGFEGMYEVSDLGRVRSLERVVFCSNGARKVYSGRVLRPGPRPSGHLTVSLGAGHTVNVHTLVLTAFKGARPYPSTEARHLDGNEQNNRETNLKWSTKSRNRTDRKYHRSASHYILTPETAREIKLALKAPYYGYAKVLAEKYGVSRSTISAIREGRFHADIVV